MGEGRGREGRGRQGHVQIWVCPSPWCQLSYAVGTILLVLCINVTHAWIRHRRKC